MSEKMISSTRGDGASVGLVLSGGGAKGAYQAGVLKALSELDVQVDVIAGASIGTLNGAIISAADNQAQAASNLRQLWLELAEITPLRIGSKVLTFPSYLALLAGFGLTSPMIGAASTALMGAPSLFGKFIGKNVVAQVAQYAGLADVFSSSDEGVLCNMRIKNLIDRFLSDGGLSGRIPLYASVYPTQGAGVDLLRILGSVISIDDTADSEFIHIQKLPCAEQKKVLLASAALPLLYAPQEINGQLYSDGGQGGWSTIQGNTPITPLLNAGCKYIVVTHLSDGSLWDRSLFPGASIIEIRPKTAPITRKDAVSDLLGFDNEKIPSWIKQGYDDTIASIAPILKTLNIFGELNHSERMRDEALKNTGEQALHNAMERLDR